MGWGNEATLMLVAGVALQMSGSTLHQGRWWEIIKKLDMEGCLPIPYPLDSCGGHSVYHLLASMGCDVNPSAKCIQSCRHPCLPDITWSLHLSSVDALADVHSRSRSFPLIHPREVCLAWHWVIAWPLFSHGVFLLSLPLGVGLTGVGLVHLSCAWQMPKHREMPVSDVMGSLLQWRMLDCPQWYITS